MAAYNRDLLPAYFSEEYATQGSGNEIALGALAMGASAVDAVAVAIRFDAFSGGEIEAVSFETQPGFDKPNGIATMRAGAPSRDQAAAVTPGRNA